MIRGRVTVTVPAPTSDLTTLATLKLALGVSDTTQDVALARYIRAASAAIVAICGWPLGRRTVSEVFRVPPANRLLRPQALDAHTLVLSGRNVTIVSLAEDATILDASSYEVDSPRGMIRRLDGSNYTTWAGVSVTAVYSYGYALPGDASPTLPAEIEDCCVSLASAAWRARDRDPGVTSEQVEGVGRVGYSDRGVSGVLPDDAIRAALVPYMAIA